MENNGNRGSLIVESLVMLGLIATMTPILYKHVAERREDIENINKANTFLLIKRTAEEYISENKDILSVGATTVTPADLGLEIDGYLIGIKKENDGTINAMIACTEEGGSDFRAGKVASLIGVSAGIYSNTDALNRAWGINGVWAEEVANYGFSALPSGIPVVTTSYDIADEAVLNINQIIAQMEGQELNSKKVEAEEFCLKNEAIPEDERCISEWNIASFNPIEVISQCNADYTAGVNPSTACTKGWEKNLNRSCSDIAIKYKGAGFNASSGIYALTTGENTRVERACYFVNGILPTSEQLITAVRNNDAIARRYDWENQKLSSNCDTIIANWSGAPTGFYNHVTGVSSYNANQPCVFTGSRIATNPEVITQCNSAAGTAAACRYGWNANLNRSCERVIATNTSAGSGWYNITTSSTASSLPCYFVGTRVATAAETIVQCNTATTSSAMNTNIACRYGYVKGYNTSCSAVTGNYSAGSGKTNSIASSAGGSRECCSCTRTCAVIGTVSGGECRDVNGWGWVRSTGAKNYWDSQTFCSNLGMTLKSRAQIQSAGLWNPGSGNPFGGYWVWSTDAYSGCDCGWLVFLGSSGTFWGSRSINGYALCGPAL